MDFEALAMEIVVESEPEGETLRLLISDEEVVALGVNDGDTVSVGLRDTVGTFEAEPLAEALPLHVTETVGLAEGDQDFDKVCDSEGETVNVRENDSEGLANVPESASDALRDTCRRVTLSEGSADSETEGLGLADGDPDAEGEAVISCDWEIDADFVRE